MLIFPIKQNFQSAEKASTKESSTLGGGGSSSGGGGGEQQAHQDLEQVCTATKASNTSWAEAHLCGAVSDLTLFELLPYLPPHLLR